MAIDARDDFRGQMMFAQNLGQNIGSALGAYRKQKVEQGVANVMSNPNYDNQTRYEELQKIKGWADTEAGKAYQEYQTRMAQQQEQEQRIRGSAISYLSQDGTDPSMFEHVPTEALRSVASNKFAQSYIQPQGEAQPPNQDVFKHYTTTQNTLNSLQKQRQDILASYDLEDDVKQSMVANLDVQIKNWQEISQNLYPQVQQQFGFQTSNGQQQSEEIPEWQQNFNNVMSQIRGDKSFLPGEEAQTEGEFFVPGEQAWIEGKRPTDKQNGETNEEYLKRLISEGEPKIWSYIPGIAKRQREEFNKQITAAGLKRGMSKAQIDSIINEPKKPVDIKNPYLTFKDMEPEDIDKAYEVYYNRLMIKDAAMSRDEFAEKASKDPEFLWQYYKRRNPDFEREETKLELRQDLLLNTQGAMPW